MARILLIDDDELLVELVRYTLEAHGHDVLTAPDGVRGLQLLQREPADVIVLDGILPGLDGLEVLKQLRTDARTAHIPVVMLSARKEDRDVLGGLSMGADDYLTKPFIPEELAIRVDRVLARQPAG